jgi:TetR/AcrR family tetracycline transcriptional repressor
MAVTRDEVVAVAITLLNETGLDGLTLRRLADRLGIRAPTLYWHVRDKRELLDLMADAIMREATAGRLEPAPDQSWWDWLAGLARGVRAALLAHRDSALVVSANTPVPQSYPAIEQELRPLVDAGFPPAEALTVLRLVGTYAVGDVLDAQAVHRDGPPEPAAETFPLLHAALGDGTEADRFEYGLAVMIDGLRARLHAIA